MKASHHLGSETQKMQMLAETMATTFKKGNEGCFTCGDKNHLERDSPKKANKKPPRICPCCCRGIHWAKDCKSKLDIEGKPILGNSKQGTPRQVPYNKNQGQILSFPSTSGSDAIEIPALNDFSLDPQAVPSRASTRVFGPLPHKPSVFYLANLV